MGTGCSAAAYADPRCRRCDALGSRSWNVMSGDAVLSILGWYTGDAPRASQSAIAIASAGAGDSTRCASGEPDPLSIRCDACTLATGVDVAAWDGSSGNRASIDTSPSESRCTSPFLVSASPAALVKDGWAENCEVLDDGDRRDGVMLGESSRNASLFDRLYSESALSVSGSAGNSSRQWSNTNCTGSTGN